MLRQLHPLWLQFPIVPMLKRVLGTLLIYHLDLNVVSAGPCTSPYVKLLHGCKQRLPPASAGVLGGGKQPGIALPLLTDIILTQLLLLQLCICRSSYQKTTRDFFFFFNTCWPDPVRSRRSWGGHESTVRFTPCWFCAKFAGWWPEWLLMFPKQGLFLGICW